MSVTHLDMIEALFARLHKLNAWERDFIRSVKGKSFILTEKQKEILKKLYKKY